MYAISFSISDMFCCSNIFCALCNGVIPSVYTVLESENQGHRPSVIYSFSGLMSFAKRDEHAAEPQNYCETGLIFDVIKVTLR